jgi:hypothetical protein
VSSSVEIVEQRSWTGITSVATRVLLRWHLLSLDAPTVAALWTWFVARACGVSLSWPVIAAMFLAVWVLYAADRLLDARSDSGEGLEARHVFHHQHRRGFRRGIVLACFALAALLPGLPWVEARLYLMLGALLVAWFTVIHTGARPLPKEFVVGIFFAAAVFVPAAVGAAALGPHLLIPATLFGALCCLNCLFIFVWEQEQQPAVEIHPLTRMASRRVVLGACVLAFAGSCFSRLPAPPRLTLAVGLASALLLMLHQARGRFDRTTLRALADLALLTPLLVEGLLR